MEKGPGLGKNLLEKAKKYTKQWGLIAALATSPAFLESCSDGSKLEVERMSGKNLREFLANNPEAPRLNEATAYEMAFFDAISNSLSEGEEIDVGVAVLTKDRIKWDGGDPIKNVDDNGTVLTFNDGTTSDVTRSPSRFLMKEGSMIGGIQFDVIENSSTEDNQDDYMIAPVTGFNLTLNTHNSSAYKNYELKDVNGEIVAQMDEEGKKAYELFMSTMEWSVDDAFQSLNVVYDREENLLYFGPKDNRMYINVGWVIRGMQDPEKAKRFVEVLKIIEGKE